MISNVKVSSVHMTGDAKSRLGLREAKFTKGSSKKSCHKRDIFK
jgi:hypothetical protein